MAIATIGPRELYALRCRGETPELIDVRTPAEFGEIHADFARNLPLDSLDPAAVIQARQGAAGSPLYVICKSGGRSKQACEKLMAAGCADMVSVRGRHHRLGRGRFAGGAGQEGRLLGAAGPHRGRIAGRLGGRLELFPPGVCLPLGLRRRRPGLRGRYRHLRHGHAPGPHALEPCEGAHCGLQGRVRVGVQSVGWDKLAIAMPAHRGEVVGG